MKKNFFSKWSQKMSFSSICCYFGYMSKQRFLKRTQKRPLPRNIDIFNGFMNKNEFFKMISILRSLHQNIDIYGFMDKTVFVFKWPQKTSFSSICCYFRLYGQKTTFTKWSKKKRRFFSKNSVFFDMLIFLDIWTKNHF